MTDEYIETESLNYIEKFILKYIAYVHMIFSGEESYWKHCLLTAGDVSLGAHLDCLS